MSNHITKFSIKSNVLTLDKNDGSSNSILKCFKPDNIYINGNVCTKKCLVALIDNALNMDCDLILNSKLLEII